MEIGTGIFLSAIFLGTVALYVATKDRWNWKKILLWPLAIVLSLSVIGGAGIYINDQLEDRPRKEHELWGIQLGASIADVKFAKGEPSQHKDADTWAYLKGERDADGVHVVKFKDGKVRAIVYYGPAHGAPSIQRISQYSSPERLAEKFGQPSYVSHSKDGLRRLYSFEKYNVVFDLEKDGIIALGVYDSSTGPLKFSDEAKAEAERDKVPLVDAPSEAVSP